MWLIAGIAAMGAIFIGGPILFLLSLGSFINHMGGGEQDDDERLDMIKTLAEQGCTNAEIAREVGVSERQVIRLKPKAGVELRASRQVSPEQRAEIRRLSEEEGWPAEEIMATLGVTRSAVDAYCVPGPGQEWRNTAARLALDHRALWNELRGHR